MRRYFNENKVLYIFTFIGLVFYVLIKLIIFYTSGAEKDLTFFDLIVIYSSRALGAFIVFVISFRILDYLLSNASMKKLLIFFFLPFCFLEALLWSLLGDFFNLLVGYGKFNKLLVNIDYFTVVKLLPVFLFNTIYFLVRQWEKTNLEKENSLKAFALANEAQSMMLRYQINPHFLFNSLNTIRAVILDDKEKARLMITELSEYFRYTLTQNINTKVKVSGEIDAIKNYLEIQKIRFEENLIVSYDIAQETMDLEIPIFIIHPLVENAVKYGIQTSKMPLSILMKIYLENNNLIIRVINSGKLINNEINDNFEGTKTGLKNIRQRLELNFGSNADIEVKQKENFVFAEIKIMMPSK